MLLAVLITVAAICPVGVLLDTHHCAIRPELTELGGHGRAQMSLKDRLLVADETDVPCAAFGLANCPLTTC
jgi:hypothetical protein